MPLPVTLINENSTFRAWFNLTNNVASILNANVVADNVVAVGAFIIAAASNLAVSNVFFVNGSLILTKANTTLAANVTVSSNTLVFNLASNTFIIQPISGTIVNTSIVVNAASTFLAPISANANVSITNGQVDITGNLNLICQGASGFAQVANGPLGLRNILFTSANAMLQPADISTAQVDDYNPAGLQLSTVLHLNATVDTVITGIVAPSITGAKILYIQNISSTKKITLVSANTSSAAANRFKTPNDNAVELLPGEAIPIMWTSTNSNWRVAGGAGSTTFPTITVTGATILQGTLSVAGNSTFTTNISAPNALFVDVPNTRVGVGAAAIAPYNLQVTGNTGLQKLVLTDTFDSSANVSSSANVYLANSSLIADASNKNLTIGNTITGTSVSLSHIRNLKSNTFAVDVTTTLSSNTTLSGNTTCSAVMTVNGTNGRFVLPVGTDKWAT